jgi:alcohol dehydrogenase
MFGIGASRRIVEVAQRREVRSVLLVADQGVVGAGLVGPVVRDLESASIGVVVYDRVSANPRDSEVDAGAAIALAEGCDHIVAIGGGSPIDCAKGISVVMAMGGSIRDYDHHPRISDRAVPVIAIPTTAGTGSEVTIFAVITDASRSHKMAFGGGPVAPRVALVDPELTVSLPPALTAGTGMDALTHAVEAYVTVAHNPVCDTLALKAVSLIASALPRAYADGSDLDARTDMMLGSTLAGMAFSGSDLGPVHCMSESAGGVYDVPHGYANAIYLPYVMGYNASAVPERTRDLGLAMSIGLADADVVTAAKKTVEAVAALARDVGIPRPDEIGIPSSGLAELAVRAASHPCAATNPRPIDADAFLALFQKAHAGDTPLA